MVKSFITQAPDQSHLSAEHSLIAFNWRIIERVTHPATPALERLRYLCIVSNNLDEFFEVRMAHLQHRLSLGDETTGNEGIPLGWLIQNLSECVHRLIKHQYELFNTTVISDLNTHQIHFLRRDQWDKKIKKWSLDYFMDSVLPLLTPMGLDPTHPFPHILNKSLNFAIELEGQDAFGRAAKLAVVQAPKTLPQCIKIPKELSPDGLSYVFLSSIVHTHASHLFPGLTIKGFYQFRLTRNSELFLEEEETEPQNLRWALAHELSHRQFGHSVRLEVADTCSEIVTNYLLKIFELKPQDLYRVNGPVNLVRLITMPDEIPRSKLKYPTHHPTIPESLKDPHKIWARLKRGDILLHHPYESFQPLVRWIQEAAQDPLVVAIKQTVYRTGTDSELMEALITAAQRGKEVTVIVELLARFDEEANSNWAERLEKAGAHVIYGVYGYKIHAKMALIIRRERLELKRYAHLGTGNYHSKTTKSYTDLGLLTAHEEITHDLNQIFLQISSRGHHAEPLKHLIQAPFALHTFLLNAIHQEKQQALKKQPSKIIVKVNGLTEPKLIKALLEAHLAGVEIILIVRGICLLTPPPPKEGQTPLRVLSVLGRFLEHHRIYYFENGGDSKIYLSSADWMERNLWRRIELCFPILNSQLKKRIYQEGLTVHINHPNNSWCLDHQGQWHQYLDQKPAALDSQTTLLNHHQKGTPL